MTSVRDRPEKRADEFLELVRQGKRGRLKLYIGFAAGVGKTYRMLEEAHALRERGVDVVVGLRRDARPAGDRGAHRGPGGRAPAEPSSTGASRWRRWTWTPSWLGRPEVAVVDELAHTNVPGSRNRKRYQDVQELLAAGINVIGAFNVQHLESLNDLVERATGVRGSRDHPRQLR